MLDTHYDNEKELDNSPLYKDTPAYNLHRKILSKLQLKGLDGPKKPCTPIHIKEYYVKRHPMGLTFNIWM